LTGQAHALEFSQIADLSYGSFKITDCLLLILSFVSLQRLGFFKSKGCKTVVAANTDAWANAAVANALTLTEAKAKAYVEWLISEAKSRNLTLGLTKDVDPARTLFKNNPQWAANATVGFVLDWGCYKEGLDASGAPYCAAYSSFKNSEWRVGGGAGVWGLRGRNMKGVVGWCGVQHIQWHMLIPALVSILIVGGTCLSMC
jgi:hypothetical protein